MIPKKIHYIWLGKSEKTSFINSCIVSWRQMMPDYEIIEWNEDNIDIEKIRKECKFFDECYKRKAYAFMSDYLRFKILYENGGIYFDTDIQTIKNFDDLLDNDVFVAKETNSKTAKNEYIGTAVIGVGGVGSKLIENILDFYQKGIWESKTYISPHILTDALNQYKGNEKIKILDRESFYPYYYYENYSLECITNNTYAIHWWAKSWTEKKYNIFLNTKHIKNPVRRYIKKIKLTRQYYDIKIKRYLKRILKIGGNKC